MSARNIPIETESPITRYCLFALRLGETNGVQRCGLQLRVVCERGWMEGGEGGGTGPAVQRHVGTDAAWLLAS